MWVGPWGRGAWLGLTMDPGLNRSFVRAALGLTRVRGAGAQLRARGGNSTRDLTGCWPSKA